MCGCAKQAAGAARPTCPHACLPAPACLPADVGAGYGLLSLAAAARGHRVHAWELGPGSLEGLQASLAHNGFEHLVQVGGLGGGGWWYECVVGDWWAELRSRAGSGQPNGRGLACGTRDSLVSLHRCRPSGACMKTGA